MRSSATDRRVLTALDLAATGPDGFRGQSLDLGMGRVFGGQVLAQALVAAGRTVPDGVVPHSLHAYFLRAGDVGRPIDFAVTRVRDGRRLSVRTVAAHQDGRALVTLTTSFATELDGIDHQRPMPDHTPPDGLPTLREYADTFGGLTPGWVELDPVECRVDPRRPEQVWLRLAVDLPADRVLHDAALVYLSDVTTLCAALTEHGVPIGREEIAGRRVDGVSLDHAVWFARPARPDEWLLFVQHSPSATRGRALNTADVFTRDGAMVASLAQEGMFVLIDE